ncbi:MAG: adenine phosphoribosyltransferase [Spirochaetaceae bacterium]|jgi:adenine phosphoribosyltransferase|nr:adenine phosphoribosyltransferase [Spirochaetaceae bacterium]
MELDINEYIRKVPDFPRQGVLFYDITSILASPVAFRHCIDRMKAIYQNAGIDAVAAIEARGFVFAAPFAVELGIPLILVRKKGKLPGVTVSKSYALEYGTAAIEIHQEDVPQGKNVLLLDDLIATGGTLRAARELLVSSGAKVTDVFGVVGLPFLAYQKMLPDVRVTTLISYNAE